MKGISIIVCSVKPEECRKMLESVRSTIGTDFETLVFDNRTHNYGICQVYNQSAEKAKFPYLCFVHEDVIMATENWGKVLIDFAEATPDCGAIGFAGGTIVHKNFLGWVWGPSGRYRYYDRIGGGKALSIDELSYSYNNPNNESFAKVITLDGLFLFISKDAWKEYPFDEDKIKGFHFYDADFSLGISQHRQNYACLSCDIYHLSGGNANITYYENMLGFQQKWKCRLPCTIDGAKIRMREELANAYHIYLQGRRYGMSRRMCIRHIIQINGIVFFFLLCLSAIFWEIKKRLYSIG